MARKVPELNASSMADIAFLLLIFFLVTTTMDVDSGIYRKLPQMPEENVKSEVKVKERNVLVVLVNRNDLLSVGGDLLDVNELRAKVREFILNPNNSKKLPEKSLKDVPFFGKQEVSKGIISLQNDRGTSYKMYIKIQDELAAAFNEIRDEKSLNKWGKKYEDLTADQQGAIKQLVPMSISEAEPKNIGGK